MLFKFLSRKIESLLGKLAGMKSFFLVKRMDDEIPEEKISEEELRKHKATLKRMKKGEEGISWEEYKEFQEIREEMLKHGGTTIEELEQIRKSRSSKLKSISLSCVNTF